MRSSPAQLAEFLQYQFIQLERLELALTHRSFDGQHNNERLEFLGDSILNFVIGEALFNLFPDAKEGQLSRLRASLVKGATLTKVAKQLDLGPFLQLGAGELKSGGSRRNSILADAVEAIIGAIYLDGGLEACRAQVLHWYQPRLDGLTLEDNVKDNKTRLQECLQSRKLPLPVYQIVEVEGKSHAQHFVVECQVAALDLVAVGEGQNRRVSEQMAAGKILEQIQEPLNKQVGE